MKVISNVADEQEAKAQSLSVLLTQHPSGTLSIPRRKSLRLQQQVHVHQILFSDQYAFQALTTASLLAFRHSCMPWLDPVGHVN